MSAIGRTASGGRVFSALAVTLSLGVTACGSGGDDAAAEPTPAVEDMTSGETTSGEGTADGSPVPTTVAPVLPDGFDRGLARVTTADGTTCDICLWRATNGGDRSRGLMGVTDLGPAVGMTFEYGEPRDGWFWMKDTILPLSIAFFDDDGELVDAFDMEPCTGDPCERYFPDGRYVLAIEVPRGELGELGIAEGSRLELLDLPCDDG